MKLSVSSFNKYQTCPRLYWLEKVEGWVDTTAKPWLAFGSNFGEIMAIADIHGVDEAERNIDAMIEDPFKAAEANYLLRKWELKYKSSPEPLADIGGVSGIEYELELDLSYLVNDRFELIFTGFIDKVFEKEGELRINERKTTSDVINLKSAYWNRLNFDPQIVGYCWALGETISTPVSRVTYEVFRKPNKAVDAKLFTHGTDALEYREKLLNSLSVRVARDAEMVMRKPVYVTEDLKHDFLNDFLKVANDIHDAKVLSRESDQPELEWIRRPNACEMYRGCVYKPFCGRKTSLESTDYIVQVPKDNTYD